MIKEQEEAIERLESIDETVEEYDGNVLKADIATVLNMLKEKDKMIDLMAEWISERCLYIDDYENSCEIIQDSCNKIENCKGCIKQYFERKARDE